MSLFSNYTFYVLTGGLANNIFIMFQFRLMPFHNTTLTEAFHVHKSLLRYYIGYSNKKYIYLSRKTHKLLLLSILQPILTKYNMKISETKTKAMAMNGKRIPRVKILINRTACLHQNSHTARQKS